MQAFEFPTHLVEGAYLVIPQDYAQEIPEGSELRVILLVKEPALARVNGKTEARDADVEPGSLVELIARIQSKPSDPANIRPGNMVLLAERLANPVTEPDPSFDPIVWDRQWAQIEAEMVS
jgi:hypothetical protein